MEQKEVQFLVILFSVVFFTLLIMIISLVSYFQKKKVEYLLKQAKAKAEYDESLLKSRIENTEQHMKNMSWELHDNIGQLLSVASMQVKMMQHKSESTQEEMAEVSDIISTSLNQVRSLSKSLNPKMISNMGLRDSIKNELNRIRRLGLVDIDLEFPEQIEFSRDREILIFRIIQEGISNVLKHSEASILTVMARIRDDKVIFTVKDDGHGFEHTQNQNSHGMSNMSSRAKLLNGRLSINSAIGMGTEITLSIPQYIDSHEEV